MKLLLYTFLIVAMMGCYSPQHFSIDARKDTTIIVSRKISDRVFMTVKINGKVDDKCLMICYSNYRPDGSYIRKDTLELNNEIINQQTGAGDLYANEAVIEFKHLNNKSGDLKLEVMF